MTRGATSQSNSGLRVRFLFDTGPPQMRHCHQFLRSERGARVVTAWASPPSRASPSRCPTRHGAQTSGAVILIRGEPCTVGTYRLAENVWVAVGDYMGEPIRVQGRSEGATIRR